MRSIVFGLDGVTFDIISPLMEKGHLPNFKKLIEQGVSGKMVNPGYLASPTAWTTMTTGVNPGEHGLFDFLNAGSDYSFDLNFATNKKAPSIFDIPGLKSVVANMPATYPPLHDNKNLIVVSGMLTPGVDSEFTYPLELKKEILGKVKDYRISLDWEMYTDNEQGFMSDLKKMINSRFEMFDYLMENKNWDLFLAVVVATDRLQHLFWDEKNLLEIYSLLDDYLGKLVKKVDESDDLALFVVSDHGFGEIDKLFYLNSWLKKEGYLSVTGESSLYRVLRKVGVNRESVAKLLKKFNVNTESLRMKLPEWVKRAVPAPEIGIFQNVNWKNTKAFFFGFGNLYLNKEMRFKDGIVSLNEVNSLKEEIKSKLKEHEAVKNVYDRSEVFKGGSVSFGPDLIVQPNNKYALAKGIGDDIVTPPKNMKADHLSDGIFLAYGNGIKKGVKRDFTIFDFAPTLMSFMSREIPFNVEGRAHSDIFDE
jgi:predicted AlkP superfamily phosphohydrolase/phosphomutase